MINMTPEMNVKFGDLVSFNIKERIRVLLVYVVYPLAMATYFKKALQHRDDVDLRVAGPYTGTGFPGLVECLYR